jgi:hypothetical protein
MAQAETEICCVVQLMILMRRMIVQAGRIHPEL